MGVHVEGQIVDLMEGLVTDSAFVLLLAAVGELVILVVPFLVKAFATKLADEGLVARVDADVRVERGAAIEGFAALVTLMWFFLGMDNFVSAESAGLAEAFATDFAHKRSSSGVDRHVAGEVIVSIEHLAAHFAGEVFGFAVSRAPR